MQRPVDFVAICKITTDVSEFRGGPTHDVDLDCRKPNSGQRTCKHSRTLSMYCCRLWRARICISWEAQLLGGVGKPTPAAREGQDAMPLMRLLLWRR